MSKSEILGIAIACLLTAIGFFVTGPIGGGIFLFFAIVALTVWFYRRDDERVPDRSQPDRSSAISEAVTPLEWGQLRYRFEQSANHKVMASWSMEGTKEAWHIRGGTPFDHNLYLKDYCASAGVLLSRSTAIWATIPETERDHMKSEPDHVNRWLLYLKFREGLSDCVTITNSAEGLPVTGQGGRISDLVGASSRACTNCETILKAE